MKKKNKHKNLASKNQTATKMRQTNFGHCTFSEQKKLHSKSVRFFSIISDGFHKILL